MVIRTETSEPLVLIEEEEGPPAVGLTTRQWMRRNLFSNWYNTLFTIVFSAAGLWLVYRLLNFVLFTSRWEVIRRNLTLLMVGAYPRDQLWRPWAALAVASLCAGIWAGMTARRAARRMPPLGRVLPVAVMVVAILSFTRTPAPTLLLLVVLAAGVVGYLAGRVVPGGPGIANLVIIASVLVAYWVLSGGARLERWGGLLLTLFLAVAGIVLSFPLGVLLALGRRSTLPVVRVLCTAYIEVIRGVPLITLLFMAALVLGFFFPPGFPVPSLIVRALIALILFTAAYIAEIVRGGLQAVPRGQVEAAQALGLSPFVTTFRIVLPQALRAVIPAMVGQFISLFKDTSLVGFIGVTELLEASRAITSQPGFSGQGLLAETLLFASFIYWVGSYSMSRASQRLEKRLGVGER